ncbi:unnamed protein product [Prunus armeniaca]
MEHSIFGRCIFKNKMVTIPLYSDSTYMCLCSDICSRFDELEVGAFEITYLVADYPPYLLESDLDVRVMYLSLLNEKKNIVTIAVKECQLLDEGECIRDWKSTMMCSKVLSSILAEQIASKPLMKPIEIVKDFKKYYGLDISYHSAWYGKELGRKRVHGDESMSYRHLAWYVGAVLSSNYGSHCTLECDPETSGFKQIFISFHACIEGFKYCRPLLFLNGTFIKNKYKGHLLAATGKNGNQDAFEMHIRTLKDEGDAVIREFLKILPKENWLVAYFPECISCAD